MNSTTHAALASSPYSEIPEATSPLPTSVSSAVYDGSTATLDNADVRGGTAPNGKPSYTNAQAGNQLTRNGYHVDGATQGQAATFTYGYKATAYPLDSNGAGPNGTTGFSRITAAQMPSIELAFQSWSDVANLTFVRVGSGTTGEGAYTDNATILLSNYSGGAAGDAAFGYFPGSTAASSTNSDVFVNNTFSYNANPSYLNYGREVFTHEIGHTLGLQHPGDYDASMGSPTYNASAVYYEDDRQFTVMSYFSETNTGANYTDSSGTLNYASAPLMDDIAAIQKLYGANMSAFTGDTVYGFHSNTGRDYLSATSATSPVIFCAWDAGGNDTFDFSGYSQNATIDLRQGFFSSVGGLVGNVSIAMGAVIENAIGGSGADTITGNASNNVITGGGGNDVIDGGAGVNTAVFSGPRASYTVTTAANGTITVVDNRPGSPDGTDTLTNIQTLRFSDTAATTIQVSTEAQLNQAIAAADETGATGPYVIQLTGDIKLGTDIGTTSTYGGQTISNPAELFAVNLHNGVTLTIDGQGHKIDGSSSDGQYSYYRGLFIYSGSVTVQNLTIANTKATGGTGYDGGGGGAGLGGGLFVADDSANGASAAVVTLDGVTLTNNNATGGGTIYSGNPHYSAGAGGGFGGTDATTGSNGAAVNGGGGDGSTANGGSDGGPMGGMGIILGAASGGSGATTASAPGSGTAGGLYGGGGGATNHTNGQTEIDAAGGGGGVGGAAATDEARGGAGGFGGGGGTRANGGFGGGGGEGGADYNHDGVTATASAGGNGGFGGGGGGSSVSGGVGGFGAANGSSTLHYSGGGGLGAGGAIFVQGGASLTIKGNSSVTGGSVTGGNSTVSNAAIKGSAYGSGIFLQGNETIILSAAAGQTVTIGSDIADQTGSGGTGANAGAGSIIISGAGTVALTGNNTFTGGVTLQSGSSFSGNAGKGGVTAGAGSVIRITSVDSQYNAVGFGTNPIALNGGALENDANSYAYLASPITVGAQGGSLLSNGQFINLTGSLSGSGALSIGTPNGSGGATLSANETGFTGSITVQPGNVLGNGTGLVFSSSTGLRLASAGGVDLEGQGLAVGSLADAPIGAGYGYIINNTSTMATLTVGADGTSTTYTGTIGRSYSNGDPDQVALRKVGAGTLTLKGQAVLPGGLTIDGGTLQIGDGSGTLGAITTPTIADNGALFFNTGAFNVTVPSVISGSGTLSKSGIGTLIVSGTSTFSGAAAISGGSLSVEGKLPAAVTIGSGAVLEGHGTVGAVTIATGGRLAPGGNNGGSGASSAATLNTGSISFGAGSYWSEEINGYSPGTYDALNVTGTVNINGVTLSLLTTNGYSTVSTGTTFTVITNDGSDAVTGSFANQNSAGDILRQFAVYGSSAATTYTYTQAYHVNTAGGDGNDVTLTMINTQPVIYQAPTSVSVTGSSFAFNTSATTIGVADADEGSQQTLTTTVTAAHGTLRADGYFSGEGTGSLSLSGFSASSTSNHIGKLVYTPNPGYNGTDTLTVTVKDDSGASNDTQVRTVTLNVSGQTVHPPAPSDFNADGTSDILLQNGGTVVAWTMGNGVYQSGATFATGATGFSVVGKGDFNADGTTDILLQNGGTVVEWLVKNGAYQSGSAIATGADGYKVVGTGDFNGDGTSDILLQSGGTVVEWIMKNGVYQSGGVIARGADGYTVVGTGDFNGDGTTDILLQNGGTVVEWLMKNGVYQSGGVIARGVDGYTVVGTGDFNGDGTTDIVLQNGGTVVDWIMKNGVYQSGNLITTGAAGFTVVGTGDYNGDGTSDIVLQNSSSGAVVDWIMLAGQYSTGHQITSSTAGFVVV